MVKAEPCWGVIGGEATVHGHLHVHAQVVHGRHVWTVAQQTLVDWMKSIQIFRTTSNRRDVQVLIGALKASTWRGSPLVLGLLQGAQQLFNLV